MRRRPQISGFSPLALLCVLWLLLASSPPAQAQDARSLELERVVVAPESRALHAAVSDLLGLRVGDAFGVDELVTARRRLQLSGWFTGVEVYARRGSRQGAVILHVDADLDQRVRVETGLEHEPFDGWAFTVVGLRAHHALGPASTARLGWKLGPRRSMLEADLELRRIKGSRFDLLLHARGGGEVWHAIAGEDIYEQVIARGALNLGLRARLSTHWSATWTAARSFGHLTAGGQRVGSLQSERGRT